MSLLEVITKASAEDRKFTLQSEYPIILNSADAFLNLKPKIENPDATALAIPVAGWEFSQTDAEFILLVKKFFTKLRIKLKDTNKFDKGQFFGILVPFLEIIKEKIGITVEGNSSDHGYVRQLFEKEAAFMGQDVVGLILEACVSLEIWDVVEASIVNNIVYHSLYSNLIMGLVAKKRSDLLCLCVKHAPDLGFPELLSILKYFLVPSNDAYGSMKDVRKDWESQALLAVENASDKNLPEKKSRVAKEASILLMLAHDGFSTSELCLHYLVASLNVDEMILSTAIAKLNGKEMMNLIRYLGKWFKKYEMFPQAAPCPKAPSKLGLKACDWVPKLEDVARWLGLVLDENFSSLVLHPEFHEELKSIEGLVSSLSSEAKLCCSVETVVEHLKNEAKSEQN